MDGNPTFKHSLTPGEHKAKGLAHVAGKTHLRFIGPELGARAGGEDGADMSEEIKCEAIKGQIRELRDQFHQTQHSQSLCVPMMTGARLRGRAWSPGDR